MVQWLVNSQANSMCFGTGQWRKERVCNKIIIVVVENGVNAVWSFLSIEMSDCYIVNKVAASTLQPCFDADVGFFAPIVYKALQSSDLVPISFACALTGAQYCRNLSLCKRSGNLAIVPFDIGYQFIWAECDKCSINPHLAFVTY